MPTAGLLEGGGGLAAIIGTVTVILRPWGAKAKQRRQEKRIFKIWMNGQPEVKGVFDAVVAAPIQMKNMKDHIEVMDAAIGKIQNGMTKLTERVVEGNRETNRKIEEIRTMLDTGNGGDTNSPGDLQQRRAKRDGDWIDDQA
jgi:hypothetical protein